MPHDEVRQQGTPTSTCTCLSANSKQNKAFFIWQAPQAPQTSKQGYSVTAKRLMFGSILPRLSSIESSKKACHPTSISVLQRDPPQINPIRPLTVKSYSNDGQSNFTHNHAHLHHSQPIFHRFNSTHLLHLISSKHGTSSTNP